ncbi:MAG: nucleotidyl transferase AbiEii/AbiGii toxin family protein, partial [Candidatus Micrarchaeota archaeon]
MKEFNLTVIREQARKEKIGLADAEKDYVLSVMLVELSKLPEADDLVFKGGTCLKKVYFQEYRFSSDLDFTVVTNIKSKLKTKVIEIFQNKEIESVQFLKAIDKTEKDKNTLRLSVQYESKVASFQGKKHVDSVWLDFNFDSKVSI